MPFQPVPNGVKIEIRFSQNGALTENVLHADVSGSTSEAPLVDIASVVDGIVKSDWLPQMHGSITFLETVVTDLSTEGGDQFVLSAGSGHSGGVGGFRLPNEVSIAVRLKAETGGRHGSGRIYWQGVADGQVTGTNFITSSFQTGLLDAIQTLIDALEAINVIVSILSRIAAGVERLEGILYGPVTPSLYDTTLDSQRRRKPGLGT